jgi:hypothetical protein
MATRIYECTISGRDGGGYVWQNVFHVEGDDSAGNEVFMLKALTDYVTTNIVPVLAAAQSGDGRIYDVAARQATASSFTYHNPIDVAGTRAGGENVGAVCGKIAWFPLTGSRVGHQFISGCLPGDYVGDVLQPAYKTLLDDLITVFMAMDGTPALELWQFVVLNKKTVVATHVAAGVALVGPGVLSKRVRA